MYELQKMSVRRRDHEDRASVRDRKRTWSAKRRSVELRLARRTKAWAR